MCRVAGFATTTLSRVKVVRVFFTSSYRGGLGREIQSEIGASCVFSSMTRWEY